MPILAMPISHSKQVHGTLFAQIGCEDVSILVGLHWVLGHEADPRCKGKFTHNVSLASLLRAFQFYQAFEFFQVAARRIAL